TQLVDDTRPVPRDVRLGDLGAKQMACFRGDEQRVRGDGDREQERAERERQQQPREPKQDEWRLDPQPVHAALARRVHALPSPAATRADATARRGPASTLVDLIYEAFASSASGTARRQPREGSGGAQPKKSASSRSADSGESLPWTRF